MPRSLPSVYPFMLRAEQTVSQWLLVQRTRHDAPLFAACCAWHMLYCSSILMLYPTTQIDPSYAKHTNTFYHRWLRPHRRAFVCGTRFHWPARAGESEPCRRDLPVDHRRRYCHPDRTCNLAIHPAADHNSPDAPIRNAYHAAATECLPA